MLRQNFLVLPGGRSEVIAVPTLSAALVLWFACSPGVQAFVPDALRPLVTRILRAG